MKLESLDVIVNTMLLQRGYSNHWYFQFMISAVECLRELSFDDLKVVSTKLIPVDEYNQATLPDDYVDYTRIALQCGQLSKPLVSYGAINNLAARNSDLSQSTYSQAEPSAAETYTGYSLSGFWNTVTWNSYGENVGRLYGYGAGTQTDTFKVVPERNVIQLNENITTDFIVLEYISNGTDSDNATQVTPYAIQTIQEYILYKMKANTRTYSAGETEMQRQVYLQQRRILRARLSDLTLDKLKRIIQQNSKASIK